MKKTFAQLFKKYRLRAEFERLSDLGNALAEKGIIYEDSLFSHWQKGNRVPHNRAILLSLIYIFVERKAMNSIEEANEFLVSSNQGYLTKDETQQLPHSFSHTKPFQVPREIAYFTGREKLLQHIAKKISQSSIFLLYGPSGVGKTAFAIHIGHKLKQKFSDGVLWYKVDTANPMDILLSIAQTFNENISSIQDPEIRASIVRSILANKKILLILDNVELDTNIRILLPNSSSSVIITSKYKHLPIDAEYESLSLNLFNAEEAQQLFYKILSENYTKKYQQELLQIGEKVENLPLALTIYAKQLNLTKNSPKQLLQNIEQNKIILSEMSYEDKNLYNSIDISFQSLKEEIKEVFLSLSIFEGKDFSLDAIRKINNISIAKARDIIQQLINTSLVEESIQQRYRLHPLIKNYIKQFASHNSQYGEVAEYYTEFLEKNKHTNKQFYKVDIILPEVENILYILDFGISLGKYEQVINIWRNFSLFLYQTGDWGKIIKYGELIYFKTIKEKKYFSENYIKYCLDTLARVYYFQGNETKLKKILTHELQISRYLKNNYLIAFSNTRLGKFYQYKLDLKKALVLLTGAIQPIEQKKDFIELAYTYKFIGEIYIYKNEYENALDNFFKASKIVAKTKDIILSAIISSTIANLYYLRGKHKPARKYLLECISVEKEYNIRIGLRVLNYLTLSLIEKENNNIAKSKEYFSLAKQENLYLNLNHKADKIFAIVHLLKEKLQQADYYIFEK